MDPKDYLSKTGLLEMFQRDPLSMTPQARYSAVKVLVRRHGLSEYVDPVTGGICFSKSECLAVWRNLKPLPKAA